jgi:hypothetical protein
VRSNSAWGASEEKQPQDLASLLRSPLFFGAAVVIVAVVWVIGALNAEKWVEVAPIAVLQEEDVLYLEDEGIFVLWNEGDPYGIHEDAGSGDGPVVYCTESSVFLASDGRVFDRTGRPTESGEGLAVLPARMDGHVVFVDADPSNGERSSEPTGEADSPACDPPGPGDRGLEPSA